MTPQQRAKSDRATKVLATAAQKSQETVVQQLATMKVQMSNTLDTIANSVSSELATLKEVQEAVELKKLELKNLQQIEVEANTLIDLKAQQELEKISHTQQMADKLIDLTRKEEQYQYDLAKSHRDQQEEFQKKLDAEVAVQMNLIDGHKSSLDAREAAVSAKESELVQLHMTVSQFEERLKKEVGAAVAIATNSLKKDLTNEFALKELQLKNDLALKQAEIVALRNDCAAFGGEMAALKAAANEATLRVQSIAEKAIDGASKQNINIHSGQDVAGSKR